MIGRACSLLAILCALLGGGGCATIRPSTVRQALPVPDYAPVRAHVVRASEGTARVDASAAKVDASAAAARGALARAKQGAARLTAELSPAERPEVQALMQVLDEVGSKLDDVRAENGDLRIQNTAVNHELEAAKAELDAKNAALDKLAADYRAKIAEANRLDAERNYWQQKHREAVSIIWWYRARFWGPILLACIALAVFLLTRFTAWGARTLGPFVVGAERIAIRTTTGLSPP